MFGEANQPGGFIMGDIDDDNNAGALPQDYMYVGILMESQVGVPAPACLAAAGYEETKGFSASLITLEKASTFPRCNHSLIKIRC